MVQREVGERLAARAGHAAPTARLRCSPSSRARSGCFARSRGPSSGPCPTSTRCSSGCADAARPRRPAAARSSCTTAFAHRRKALAGVAGAGARRQPAEHPRASAGRADELGHPVRRARRAASARGVPRARARADDDEATSPARPAKVNLCLFLGPTRADGRHELVTAVRVGLARRRARLVGLGRPRRPTRSSARASRARTSPRDGARASCGRAAGRPAAPRRDRQAHPRRRRDGRRVGRCRRRAAAAAS